MKGLASTRFGRAIRLAGLATAGVIMLPGVASAAPAPGFTELVSQSSANVQGNNDSELPSISSDGRFVAFASSADNLVPGDTNQAVDVFVRDRVLGTTERVSVSSKGRQGDGNSGLFNGLSGPSISGDGRFVAFDSDATNLVRGDRNGASDVFVHDRQTGETTRVSVATSGAEGSGTEPEISANGRFVAFVSFSDTLVPGDTNFTSDIFVHDRQTGVTERISQAPDGSDANGQSLFTPNISADGRFVYFTSFANNLVANEPVDSGTLDAYLFDRQTGTMSAITSTQPATGVTEHGVAGGISGDGRFLTFTTGDTAFLKRDTNGFEEDAFLVDRQTGTQTLVSVNDARKQGNDATVAGDVSDDGHFVSMVSEATNFAGAPAQQANVYLRDLVAGTTRIASVATDGSFGDFDSGVVEPDTPSAEGFAMSRDAKVIAFASRSSTFVPENQSFFAFDIFARDMH